MRTIPVTGKVISKEDKQTMIDCINSGEEIAYGTYTEQFEKALAEYIGVKHAYFVNSGSSANLLAFATFTSPDTPEIWRTRRGDEVITVAASFPTTIAPIIQYGCVPVFIDIKYPTYNIDVVQLENALSDRTKGVFIAHTLGNPFDIDAVKTFCNLHKLWLIEDNCDAFSSLYRGKKTGSFGQISTTSFYAAHEMTTGQGGAVFTDDPILATIIRSMRGWGKACICPPNKDNVCGARFQQQHGALPFGYDHKYVFSNFGYNLGSTNIQAALGLKQLEHMDEFTVIRHRNFKALEDALHGYPQLGLAYATEGSVPSWFGFPILLDKGIDRYRIINYLTDYGVGTRLLFAGNILCQPCFTRSTVPYRVVGGLEDTTVIMNHGFFIGSWHGLSLGDIEYEISVVKRALAFIG